MQNLGLGTTTAMNHAMNSVGTVFGQDFFNDRCIGTGGRKH